ncbi:hypothetical protein ABTZ99_26195 [Actinosynnema sp. NPDC002837]
MAAAMAFGAASPALALGYDSEVSGGGTDVVTEVSQAGVDWAGEAEMGTQGRKWGFPWW